MDVVPTNVLRIQLPKYHDNDDHVLHIHICNKWLFFKKVMEEEEKKSKPKVGVNVVMVNCGQPILDVFVTTRGQKNSYA
jgi:hypothetical protein